MALPNFLIVGAMKSGTTAIYEYLLQHPQVFMSPLKEPKFFALENENFQFRGPRDDEVLEAAVSNLDDYQNLFEGASTEIALGEASVWYLYSEKAPIRIKKYIPNAKIIIMLRNPVDRAYSHYLNLVRDGREYIPSFSRAIDEEDSRIADNWGWSWHYSSMSFYYPQVKRYLDIFGRKQVRVYIYDDFLKEPHHILKDISSFLDIDVKFSPDISAKHNVSGVPKNKYYEYLHSLVLRPNLLKLVAQSIVPEKIRRMLAKNILNFTKSNFHKPSLDEEIRKDLMQIYHEDILLLQKLLDRNLTSWLI